MHAKKKWCYTVFVLSDVTGIVYNFELYTGKACPASGMKDIGSSGKVVLRLCSVVRDHKKKKTCDLL